MTELTSELARSLLDYDPATGAFVWKARACDVFMRKQDYLQWNARYAGTAALNTLTGGSYLQGRVLTKQYKAHRVAWLWVHGSWPVGEIDHINHVTTDNRISNLRDVPQRDNMANASMPKNNTTGVVGVYRDKESGLWLAQICRDYKSIKLGRFANFEDAVKARKIAEISLGFHPNHGQRNTKILGGSLE